MNALCELVASRFGEEDLGQRRRLLAPWLWGAFETHKAFFI